MAVEDITGALIQDIIENPVCPVCGERFRRNIEDWMKFECKDCGADLCKCTDIHLHNGQCEDCSWKEWQAKPKDEKIKEAVKVKRNGTQEIKEKKKIQTSLSFFK